MALDNIFQAKVWPTISALFDDVIKPVFSGRLYADVAPSLNTFPLGVYQSQDGGGRNDNHIGYNGWRGMVTIRCIDITLSGAYNKAIEVATALQSITSAVYDIDIDIDRPIKFPVEKLTQGSIYTSGLVINMGIYPKT